MRRSIFKKLFLANPDLYRFSVFSVCIKVDKYIGFMLFWKWALTVEAIRKFLNLF